MTPSRYDSPDHFARVACQLWREMRLEYVEAGAPLGPSRRAFELWIHYGRLTTTCN